MTVTSWLIMDGCIFEEIAPSRCHQHSLRGVDNSHSTEVEHHHRKRLSQALLVPSVPQEIMQCFSVVSLLENCWLIGQKKMQPFFAFIYETRRPMPPRP